MTYTRYHANDYDELRLREVAQERCGLCWNLWPKSMMADDDGRRRCPDCVGSTLVIRDAEIRAEDAARVSQRQTPPQISVAPFRNVVPWIRIMEDSGGVRILATSPLSLTRSGASKQLVITGGGFASTDTFTYSTGITDSVAAALTGTTVWTLTLVAGSTATPGPNNVTFNNHTYRGIVNVK